jgi:hypothetical protein
MAGGARALRRGTLAATRVTARQVRGTAGAGGRYGLTGGPPFILSSARPA